MSSRLIKKIFRVIRTNPGNPSQTPYFTGQNRIQPPRKRLRTFSSFFSTPSAGEPTIDRAHRKWHTVPHTKAGKKSLSIDHFSASPYLSANISVSSFSISKILSALITIPRLFGTLNNGVRVAVLVSMSLMETTSTSPMTE